MFGPAPRRSVQWLTALAAWWLAATAWAIPPDVKLNQLHHTRWTVADGAPTSARAMAQSGDGALWLGTDIGLYRFDGTQFERMHVSGRDGPPLGNISALMSAPDGSVWIGLRLGGVYRWQAGQFTAHGPAQGLPAERTIFRFAQGTDGRVWVATTDGLFLYEKDRWRRAGAEFGLPDGFINDVVTDRAGTLWVAGPEGIFSLPPQGRKGQLRHADTHYGYLAALPDGGVWMSQTAADQTRGGALLALLPSPGQQAHVGLRYGLGKPLSRIMADRDGGLWVSHRDQVMRLPAPQDIKAWAEDGTAEQAQYFGVERGLSGSDLKFSFEDRDGSLWFSTSEGLDRLKLPRLLPKQPPGRIDGSLAGLGVTDEGGPLLCTGSQGVRTEAGPAEALAQAGYKCDAMDREPSGRRWFAIDKALWWWHEGKVGKLELPAEIQPVLSTLALKVDSSGTIWGSFVRKGLFRYRDGRWTRVEPGRDGFPNARPVALERDTQGRLWLGYVDSIIAVVEHDRARTWGPAEGLQVGVVRIIAPHGKVLLIGGSEGVAMLDGERVIGLRGTGGERFENVGAVVDAGDGTLWIHAGNSIYRVPVTELEQVRRDASHRLAFERLSHDDGLRGIATAGWLRPSAVRTRDGRVWVSTSATMYALDPKAIPRNPRPPAVELRGMLADGVDAPLAEGHPLATGTRRVELRYGAILIGSSAPLRFRYRLEGVDPGWQHTLARSVTYSNLEPGSYRFLVSAANEDGVWNEAGVATRFTIPAAFHQTAWFYALCAAALALAVWAAYRLHVRQLTARIRLRADARAQERVRIARDLHDTLLQSAQGLVLGVQALADSTPDDHPHKPRMARMLARADEAIREGRQKVLGLRADDGQADLTAWFNDLAAELSERGPARVSVSVSAGGEPCALPPTVRGEVLRMGQEALINAQKHAKARHVELHIACSAGNLRLRITDDGTGMSPALMDGSERRPGHWGLVGLRERAAALGAQLAIRAGDGGGTVVEITVPLPQA